MQFKISTQLFTFLLISTAGVSALAGEGTSGGGGGKVFVCREGNHEKVYLADTYELVKSGKVKGLEKAWPESVLESVATLLDIERPEKFLDHPFLPGQKVSIGWMISHKSVTLGYEYVNELPDLDDDNIDPKTVPPGCRKVQLAIQDIEKGRVRVVDYLMSKMSMLERGFWELHETEIALRNSPGQDTTPIRRDVRTMADILSDPKYSAHQLILDILRGPTFQSPSPDPDWTSRYVAEHCPTTSYDHVPDDLKGGLAGQFCTGAREKLDKEFKEKDAETALPTLLRVPEVLHCEIVSESRNDLGWKASNFTVRLTKGDGHPDNLRSYPGGVANEYSIKFEDPALGEFDDIQMGNLLTHRHDRQRGIDRIGNMDLRIMWKGPSETTPSLFLDKYLERTGEFTGDIEVSNGEIKVNLARFTSYGVSCHAERVDLDRDLQNSIY